MTVCMRTEEPGTTNAASQPSTAVDLYWIPLGAGQHVARLSGRLFEAISARVQHRRPCDLYHSALVIVAPEGRFVIEQTPISDDHGARRGVVVEGAVGSKLAGRLRLFRYEIRRWRDGVIPDIAEGCLESRPADGRLHPSVTDPRSRAVCSRPGLGSRRRPHGRHVELELGDLMVARQRWSRSSADPATAWRPGTRMARRP